MCRNIKTLFNFDPPVTDEEIGEPGLGRADGRSGGDCSEPCTSVATRPTRHYLPPDSPQ